MDSRAKLLKKLRLEHSQIEEFWNVGADGG